MAKLPLSPETAAGLALAAPAQGVSVSPAAAARAALAKTRGPEAGTAGSGVGAAVSGARRAFEELAGAFKRLRDPADFAYEVWGRDGAGSADLSVLQAIFVSGLRSLPSERVEQRLKLVSGAECALAAVKAEGVAELAAHRGESAAEDVLRSELRASKSAARSEVAVAGELAKLPDTFEALGSGKITREQAGDIAKAAQAVPEGTTIDETGLIESASVETADKFKATTRNHVAEKQRQAGDDLAAQHQAQRRKRTVWYRHDVDGMVDLHAKLDRLAGAQVIAALEAECKRRRNNDDNPEARPTNPQRMADALTHLITRTGTGPTPGGDLFGDPSEQADPTAPKTGKGSGKPVRCGQRGCGVDFVIVADYDAVNAQLSNPRLADGNPIPPEELVKLALEARVLPALWDVKNNYPMWMGRQDRHANKGQRIALAIRDKGCIGCGKTTHRTQPHHNKHWAQGGPTDIDNLALLCPSCHNHDIHRLGKTITQNPEGQHRIKHNTDPPNTHHNQPLLT